MFRQGTVVALTHTKRLQDIPVAWHRKTVWLLLAIVNQYSTGLVTLSVFSCSYTHSTRTLYASVYIVHWFIVSGTTNIGGDACFSWKLSIASSSSVVRALNCSGWSFFNFLWSGATFRAKLSTNRRNTLDSRKIEQNSRILVEGFRRVIAPSACDLISKRRGQMKWPRW